MLLSLLLFLGFALSSFAQFIKDEMPSIEISDLPLRIYISVAKQNFRINEKIIVKFKVINESSEIVKIYPLPVKFFTYNFKIYNELGQEIECKNPYLNKQILMQTKKLKPELFERREVILYPGDSFETDIDLNQWVDFPQPGRYKIIGEFDYDYHSQKPHPKLFSNVLYIILRPTIEAEERLRKEKEEKQKEEAKVFTPEGTIEFMLEAKKTGNWEDFFKYLDLESLILGYSDFKDRYLKASKLYQRQIIEEFKNFQRTREEAKIKSYKIMSIHFLDDPKERIVTCKVEYPENVLPRLYLYTFKLRQRGNKWFVYEETAQVLKR